MEDGDIWPSKIINSSKSRINTQLLSELVPGYIYFAQESGLIRATALIDKSDKPWA